MATEENQQGTRHTVAVDLDTFIKEVYDLLGHSWKFLARELGFSDTDIAALEYGNPFELREQIHQMFNQWKRREGNRATAEKLLSAMKAAGGFDEQIKTLTGKGVLLEHQKSSADLASSLAAGARFPIQASDDAQTDSPVKSKVSAASTPPPRRDDVRTDGPLRSRTAPTTAGASKNSPEESSKASPTATTPPSDRDFVRQQRLKRFSSSASDRSDTYTTGCSDQQMLHKSPQTAATGSGLATSQSLDGAAVNTVCQSVTELCETSSVSKPAEGCTYEVGDCVRVDRRDSAPWYGVIKWIGMLTLPGSGAPRSITAGIEIEHAVKGGGDGSFGGVEYFTCTFGQGVFLPPSRLKRDDRFDAPEDMTGEEPKPKPSPPRERSTNSVGDPLSDLMSRLLSGESKGADQSDPSDSSDPGVRMGIDLFIPADRAGLVIGTGGKNIREVERLTNTSIKVEGGNTGLYGGGNRRVRVLGSEENCKKALLIILKKVGHRVDEHTAGVKTISVPNHSVGRIIGKGGATISTIKSLSGAHDIKFDDRETGLAAMLQTERQCHIHGSEEAIKKAEELIRLAIDGQDIVAGATFAAIFMKLLELGVECQEEEES